MSFAEKSCEAFIEELWSKAPVPGGGGASALCGAIGAALGGMVANLTAGKKKYAQFEDDIRRVLDETQKLKQQLLEQIDADAESFEPLSRAYGIPKDDPNRGEIMENALKAACDVPIEIMRLAAEAIDLHAELAQKGSRLAVSDVGAGVLCCNAALKAASLNVYINAGLMKDRQYAEELTKKCDAMIAENGDKAEAVYKAVMDDINKRPGGARVLYGKPVAESIYASVAEKVEKLKENGVTPKLAVVRVGDNADDIWYEKMAIRQCGKCGLDAVGVDLPGDVSEERVIDEIKKLNGDPSVHGVIIMCPLPKHIDEEKVRESLSPEKDMDGITSGSQAAVYSGAGDGYAPCTAQACIEILGHYGIETAGKTAAVLGRSLVIGKPVSMLLTARNATVTICHSKTKSAQKIAAESDIVIAALGHAEAVDKKYFSPGQIVLDVGINEGKDGKIIGDVKFDDAQAVVAAVTPSPGGVGSVTTAVLISHVAQAAERAALRQ